VKKLLMVWINEKQLAGDSVRLFVRKLDFWFALLVEEAILLVYFETYILLIVNLLWLKCVFICVMWV
jgi:hypothetical protein